MRCDAIRCDTMRCDAMQCNAVRCFALRCHSFLPVVLSLFIHIYMYMYMGMILLPSTELFSSSYAAPIPPIQKHDVPATVTQLIPWHAHKNNYCAPVPSCAYACAAGPPVRFCSFHLPRASPGPRSSRPLISFILFFVLLPSTPSSVSVLRPWANYRLSFYFLSSSRPPTLRGGASAYIHTHIYTHIYRCPHFPTVLHPLGWQNRADPPDLPSRVCSPFPLLLLPEALSCTTVKLSQIYTCIQSSTWRRQEIRAGG